ncbi:unnamed protein product, partial [Mesorhabditis spiculigera]
MICLLAILVFAAVHSTVPPLAVKMTGFAVEDEFPNPSRISIGMTAAHPNRDHVLEHVLLTTYKDGKFVGDTASFGEKEVQRFQLGHVSFVSVTVEVFINKGERDVRCGFLQWGFDPKDPAPEAFTTDCTSRYSMITMNLSVICPPGLNGIVCAHKCECPNCEPSCVTASRATAPAQQLASSSGKQNLLFAPLIFVALSL